MCVDADDELLHKVTCKTQHLIHDLLSPLLVLLLLGNNALNFNQVKTPEHERG